MKTENPLCISRGDLFVARGNTLFSAPSVSVSSLFFSLLLLVLAAEFISEETFTFSCFSSVNFILCDIFLLLFSDLLSIYWLF